LNIQTSKAEGTTNEKLWMAVIDSAIEDWVHGPGSHKSKAEFFLFQDERGFSVCVPLRGPGPESGSGEPLDDSRAGFV